MQVTWELQITIPTKGIIAMVEKCNENLAKMEVTKLSKEAGTKANEKKIFIETINGMTKQRRLCPMSWGRLSPIWRASRCLAWTVMRHARAVKVQVPRKLKPCARPRTSLYTFSRRRIKDYEGEAFPSGCSCNVSPFIVLEWNLHVNISDLMRWFIFFCGLCFALSLLVENEWSVRKGFWLWMKRHFIFQLVTIWVHLQRQFVATIVDPAGSQIFVSKIHPCVLSVAPTTQSSGLRMRLVHLFIWFRTTNFAVKWLGCRQCCHRVHLPEAHVWWWTLVSRTVLVYEGYALRHAIMRLDFVGCLRSAPCNLASGPCMTWFFRAFDWAHAPPRAILRLDVAGRGFSGCLIKIFAERGSSFATVAERDVVFLDLCRML